jgi:hypothetical protein
MHRVVISTQHVASLELVGAITLQEHTDLFATFRFVERTGERLNFLIDEQEMPRGG